VPCCWRQSADVSAPWIAKAGAESAESPIAQQRDKRGGRRKPTGTIYDPYLAREM